LRDAIEEAIQLEKRLDLEVLVLEFPLNLLDDIEDF